MNMSNLMSKILGFLTIIITLALAPAINTANGVVAADNLTNCIGMSAIVTFGAPLIILGLLAMGGLFAWKGTSGGMKEILGVVGAVIVAIIALTFMSSIITYTNALITSSGTGSFGAVIYGMIPLLIYVVIIGSIGYGAYAAYKGGGRKSKKAAVGGFV